MTISKNPFIIKELPLEAPFCNRVTELRDLTAYAKSGTNVLLYSPRRFGKTSLIKRTQANLLKGKCIVAFADLFGVVSVNDIAIRLAKSIFEMTHRHNGLFKRAIKIIRSFRPVIKPDEFGNVSLSIEPTTGKTGGVELLEETLSSLGEFIKKTDKTINIALDEFQEIVQLRDAHKIEGLMRSHIQGHKASYFFVGSRRHILLGIFNEKQRPFFQSAINYELNALPHAELTEFLKEQFTNGGKRCSSRCAEMISDITTQHPYYTQKLAFFTYQAADIEVNDKEITGAFDTLLKSEKPVFEAIIQGLAPQQIALLKSIAVEPTSSIFSIDYMKGHGLGSTGGTQGALKKLVTLDLIEKNANGIWQVVDPIFKHWLKAA